DPAPDVWVTLRPYFLKPLWKRSPPGRVGRALLRLAGQLGTALSSLPRQIHRILEDLQHGKLEVRVQDAALPSAGDRLGRRIFAGVTVGAFTLAGGQLLANARHEEIGIGLLVLAGLQLVWHL